MARSVIDPITRIEGHLRIEMEVEDGFVTDAWVSGNNFRGMETVLKSRTPYDAAQIVQRICGVCPISHTDVSAMSAENALGITIPNGARIMRNIVEATQFIHTGLLWFYNLCLLDFISPLSAADANVEGARAFAKEIGTAEGTDFKELKKRLASFASNGQMSIFSGNWFDNTGAEGYRLSPEENLVLTAHYFQGLQMNSVATDMSAIIGGKFPHIMTTIPGGTSYMPTPDELERLAYKAKELNTWMETTLIPDMYAIAKNYPDVATFGKGPGSYVAWGVFEGPGWPYGGDYTEQMLNRYFPMGVLDENLELSDVKVESISEYMGRSWYKGSDTYTSPYFITDPDFTEYDVDERYSWVKAAAYDGKPREAGALARALVACKRGCAPVAERIDGALVKLGKKPGELSALQNVLGRMICRQIETLYVSEFVIEWIDELADAIKGGNASFFSEPARQDGEGLGFWEAPRGAIYHCQNIKGGVIDGYQIVVPSTWNLSPRNENGDRGPLESALVGCPVEDVEKPINALRTVHSFDPCSGCSVHVSEPRSGKSFTKTVTPWGGVK